MNFINELMSNGPVAVMPIVFTVFGLFLGLSFKKAISGGLAIGIGFLGVSLVTNYISITVSEFATHFSELYHFNFTIIDVGWPKAAEIAFQSLIGLAIIPLCFGLNLLLIKLKLTNTLNIDLWNYWHFSFLASVTAFVLDSIILGLMIGCVDFLITNYLADLTSESVAKTYHLENTSFPNSFALCFMPVVYLLNNLWNKVFPSRQSNSQFRGNNYTPEPVLVSFVIGLALALSVNYSLPNTLYFAVVFASMVLLIPLVSSLLGQGLKPISAAIEKKFEQDNSNINVGLTTVIVIGDKSIMLVFVLLIPITLLLAILIPGNQFFPAASLSGVVYLLPLIVSTCERSIIKSTAIATVILVISFSFINLTAGVITQTALSMGVVEGLVDRLSSLDYGSSPLLTLLSWETYLAQSFDFVFGGILASLMVIVVSLNRCYVKKQGMH